MMGLPHKLRSFLPLALLALTPWVVAGSEFKVIGYLPAWTEQSAKTSFAGLTHVNYSFALPNPDGSLKDIPSPDLLRRVVERAHANGIKVSLAIGGWNDGNDSAFEKLAASPDARVKFAQCCLEVMAKHSLDGIDVDWEYPDAGASAENFHQLIIELSKRLKPAGKLLSIAVVASGKQGDGITPDVFEHIDLLNIMAYDGKDHGLYSQAEEALKYWSQRGCPRSKLILGLPFYGRSPYLAYRDIIAKDPTAPQRDTLGNIHYNNPAMIARKTQLAREQAAGVMIWELTQDHEGPGSLLKAISKDP